MRLPSTKTLAKTAVYISVAGISCVMYMQAKIKERVRNTDYFRAALQMLRQHKGAVSLLGEPIKEVGFDLSDTRNSCDGDKASFEVSVKGSKERGELFFSATRSEEAGWIIDTLELELKSQPDKRYLLKTNNNSNTKEQSNC